MISEERLQTLERLANEATEGPWYQCKDKVCDRGPWHECRETDCYVFPIDIGKNALFIASAREAVPELISRVRELEKEADWLADTLERLCPCPCPADMGIKMDTCPEKCSDIYDFATCWREAAREGVKDVILPGDATDYVCKKCWREAAKEAVKND